MELADTRDLGLRAARRVGSTPTVPTEVDFVDGLAFWQGVFFTQRLLYTSTRLILLR